MATACERGPGFHDCQTPWWRALRGNWLPAWLDELTIAPFGAHDDQVDATAGAFAELALAARNVVTVRKIQGF